MDVSKVDKSMIQDLIKMTFSRRSSRTVQIVRLYQVRTVHSSVLRKVKELCVTTFRC